MSMKIPMTTSGIGPATFWLVGGCLDQPRQRVSSYDNGKTVKFCNADPLPFRSCYFRTNNSSVLGYWPRQNRITTNKYKVNRRESQNEGSMRIARAFLTFYSLLYVTQVLTIKNSTLWSHGICVFCMDLWTNKKFRLMQHYKIGFYNRGWECLLRGTHKVLI